MKTNIVINDDCLNFMKSLPDKCIDLIHTDPPFGIGDFWNKSLHTKHYGKKKWNEKPPSKEYFEEIFRVSKNQIIWGGNYYIDLLPITNSWIIWDKGRNVEKTFMSEAEIAWTSFKTPMRIAKFLWDGARKCENVINYNHPNQRPVELYSWILEKYSKENDIIMDPFTGSGTTAISCINMNRKYICVEKEKEYFDLITKRIKNHLDGNLFAMEN